MQLMMIDDMIVNASIPRKGDHVDPNRATRVLIEDQQLSPAVALAISTGALLRRRTTIALACQAGLLAADVLTDARIAGLIA